jgi:hypothetical protein
MTPAEVRALTVVEFDAMVRYQNAAYDAQKKGI